MRASTGNHSCPSHPPISTWGEVRVGSVRTGQHRRGIAILFTLVADLWEDLRARVAGLLGEKCLQLPLVPAAFTLPRGPAGLVCMHMRPRKMISAEGLACVLMSASHLAANLGISWGCADRRRESSQVDGRFANSWHVRSKRLRRGPQHCSAGPPPHREKEREGPRCVYILGP